MSQPIVGTLRRGTLYRVEMANGALSEKQVVEEDTPVRYVGAEEGLRCYVIIATDTMVFVEFADDLEKGR